MQNIFKRRVELVLFTFNFQNLKQIFMKIISKNFNRLRAQKGDKSKMCRKTGSSAIAKKSTGINKCKLTRQTKIKSVGESVEQKDRKFDKNQFDSSSSDSGLLNNPKRWKTLNEREVLECYFELDPEWNRKTIDYIKDLVQLSEKQIYKWGYEKRRRLNIDQKEKKTINLKQVTPASDLTSPIDPDTYNDVVDSLFPDELSEEEVLSEEQKEIYDYVKEQLIARSERYEQQSDLDKLLNERIPIQNIALEAKASQEMSTISNHSPSKSVSGYYKQQDDSQFLNLKPRSKFNNFDEDSKVVDFKKALTDGLMAMIDNIFDDVEYPCGIHFDPGTNMGVIESNNLKLRRNMSNVMECFNEPKLTPSFVNHSDL